VNSKNYDKIGLRSAIFDSVQLTKSGRKIPAEVSSHLIQFNDKPAVLFISRDVSQREEAERKVKSHRNRLRSCASFANIEKKKEHDSS